jgi:ATP-dependent Clp protease adaptor protein ClpS
MSSTGFEIEERVKNSIKLPKLWKVVFLNDNHTPMEFVIDLLTVIFKHDESTAKNITLEIHETGSAVVGTYTFEVAEQKGIEATQLSRENGFPLQIQVEEE